MDSLQYSPREVDQVRKYFGVDANKIKQDILMLRKWISQQKHLPQDQDDDFLERVHLRCKFRLENTKRKLEHYYTLRGLYREFFQEKNEEFVPSKEVLNLLPMPNLTPDNHRVILGIIQNKEPKGFSYNRLIKTVTLQLELLTKEDYSVGQIWVFDLEGFSHEHIWRVSVRENFRALNMFLKAFSGRPVQLELIGGTDAVDVLLSVLKIRLSEKIRKRIHVHKSFEEAHECVPTSCLPKEYGGSLESVESLKRKWDKTFEKNDKFFNKNYNNVSDESKRIGDLPKTCCYGIEDTIRSLNNY